MKIEALESPLHQAQGAFSSVIACDRNSLPALPGVREDGVTARLAGNPERTGQS